MRERFGLRTEDGALEGVTNTIDDCVYWLGNGAYFSPEYPDCMFIIGDAYNLWNRSDVW